MGLSAGLGSANVAIRATLDKLDGDLGSARNKIEGAVQQIAANAGKSLQTIGMMALGGIGAAAGVIAGVGAALAKVTIDAAPVQGIQDAFEGLADSAGIGGDAMLAALKRGSLGMIPARDLMLSFNKAASLVGTDFAQQLPDAMQYLGKVSASTGQDMSFLMDSLVVGVGRLSPMILDNLGIQVDLASATSRAAEMFGLEAGELSKSQIQAGMMNLALEKLAINTGSMPDVSESAAAKMAQFKATIQDTKDQIGMAFLPTLITVMGFISRLAEKILPPLTEFLEGTVAPAFEKVAGVVEDFMWMLDVGVEPIDALKIALSTLFGEDFAEKVVGIVEGIGGFIDKAKEALAPVMEWLGKNVELKDVLTALGIAIAIFVLPVLWGIITAVLPVIGAFLLLVGLVALIRTAWENDFMGIRTTVETALAAIKQWWAEHGEEVKAKALEIWEKVKTTVGDALERAKEIVSTALENIKQWWAEHGEEIKAKAKEIWDKVVETFEFFKEQFSKIFEAFRLAFEGDWRGFGEKLREYWDAAWAKIKQIGETVWNAIKDFFANTDWGSVGRSILDGIGRGITSGLEAIKSAARNAAQAALDAAKGFLGIHSPSREAALRIGEPFAAGIAEGITDALPALMRAARQASMQLMQTADMQLNGPGAMVARPGESAGGRGGQSVVIYGLTLEGVQDAKGLLAELQGLAL